MQVSTAEKLVTVKIKVLKQPSKVLLKHIIRKK